MVSMLQFTRFFLILWLEFLLCYCILMSEKSKIFLEFKLILECYLAIIFFSLEVLLSFGNFWGCLLIENFEEAGSKVFFDIVLNKRDEFNFIMLFAICWTLEFIEVFTHIGWCFFRALLLFQDLFWISF